MNVFQLEFYTRLRAWNDLRTNIENCTLCNQCVEVDTFWQQCPETTHYLHPADIKSWPDPWQLLDDNMYCPYARALGIIYTLILLGITDIDLVDAIDYNSVSVVLVVVENTFVLNYWPKTVGSNKITDFDIIRVINIESLMDKIK
jgi:hypothetical protein